ncbi:unnamed protein product [Hydatigera taeniaeformis]|uniref:Tetratricopeptide repeat protein 21B n=1 Tax=Hydatigena taeniaeformis TaxID=6205 RepID=A0A3P7E626_HYDTA|nr:unnamed protein product [Hydatigera taeniaeformis]
MDMCVFAHLLLGDAYLRVEHPELAIEVYESVLRWEPGDLRVVSKMGEALVMTHEFERAVLYYESALQRDTLFGHSPLLPDLTLLLIRLKQLDRAEAFLNAGLASTKTCSVQIHTVDTLLRIYKKSQGIVQTNYTGSDRETSTKSNPDGEEDDLVTANDVTKLTRGGSGSSRELEKAIATCEEAIRGVETIHSPSITDRLKQAALLSLLARCHLANQDRAHCEQICLKLAVCQEELQAVNEDIAFFDFNIPVELFFPMVADRNASKVSEMSTFPLRRCSATFEFVPTAIIMANLLTHECDFVGVLPHLLKHLNEVPNDYRAMAHLIITYRRLGQLSTAEEYLHKVLKEQSFAKSDPRFAYVQGFYYWFRGDNNLAIRSFNVARLARDYEVDALCAMVEICLSPSLYRIFPSSATTTTCVDSDVRSVRPAATANTTTGGVEVGEETSTARYSDVMADGRPSGNADAKDIEATAYETAALLLMDIVNGFYYGQIGALENRFCIVARHGTPLFYVYADETSSAKTTWPTNAQTFVTVETETKLRSCQMQYPRMHRFLYNLHMAVSRDRVKVEKALQNFAEMNEECESVPAVYGAAVCYLLLGQDQKAKNQLKRLAKYAWTPEDAPFLERSWLLLADIYIGMDKRDMAMDMLKRCIQYNKSCYRAYEFMGLIAEKSNSYEDAATHYNTAWEILNKQDLGVGYKLALSYLKAKDYFRTVDVCHEVLCIAPNHPHIQKNILRRALDAMRT